MMGSTRHACAISFNERSNITRNETRRLNNGVLTKIYNACPFIYKNIQHMGVFTKISTVNGDPVAANTSPVTGTPATP
jgi:hypothetical protein